MRATGEAADEVQSQPWLPTEADGDNNLSEEQQNIPELQGVEQESNEDQERNKDQTTAGTETVTSKGRVIRLPERLRDYVKL